ncbi:hypothetical protein V9T40_012195 [Parthenolecanium corni]|uniref:Uncharacterized protein n=1 Tax=Parthenolecanium corni TaxID=536013 RepID=A0AAN9TA90_9HEMI
MTKLKRILAKQPIILHDDDVNNGLRVPVVSDCSGSSGQNGAVRVAAGSSSNSMSAAAPTRVPSPSPNDNSTPVAENWQNGDLLALWNYNLEFQFGFAEIPGQRCRFLTLEVPGGIIYTTQNFEMDFSKDQYFENP